MCAFFNNNTQSSFGFNNNANQQPQQQQQFVADQYTIDVKLDQSINLSQNPSSIKWIPNQNMPIFSSTFWDKTVRIFQVNKSFQGANIIQKLSFTLNTIPMNTCWNGDCSALYVGCSDGTIKMVDINTQNIVQVGKHNAAINNLHYYPNQNLLLTSAYQNAVNIWQVGQPNPALSLNVENKVLCTDFKNGVMAGATANQRLFFFDLPTVSQGAITHQQSIDLGKYSQIECISLDNKAETVGLASVDGRANISTIMKLQNGKYKMNSIITFKANKQQQNGTVTLYPVNACEFNPLLDNWFMTAGSDGVMSFWDFKARNKIKSFNYNSYPITCAAVSPSGQMVAYGNGNDWHVGTEGINKWPNRIGVHIISEQQTKFQGPPAKK